MILHIDGRLGHELDRSFSQRPDTTAIAKELLGKLLVTNSKGARISGFIVETEAYLGVKNAACQAFQGKYSTRTAVMYEIGGTAYVYLGHGIHHLFNVVVGMQGSPQAILVRALQPFEGVEQTCILRNLAKSNPKLTAGPRTLTQALGITTKQSGSDLLDGAITIEDHGIIVGETDILTSVGVGLAYAGSDALLHCAFD